MNNGSSSSLSSQKMDFAQMNLIKSIVTKTKKDVQFFHSLYYKCCSLDGFVGELSLFFNSLGPSPSLIFVPRRADELGCAASSESTLL